MKRFIYSSYTKFIAVILLILSAVLCANSAVDGIRRYFADKEHIYGFEESFEQTGYFIPFLHDSLMCVRNAYDTFEENTPEGVSFEDCLNTQLSLNVDSEKVNYYIEINGMAFTNCNAAGEEDFKNSRFFFTAHKSYGDLQGDDYTGYTDYYDDIIPNKTDSVTICAAINDSYADECEQIWIRQRAVAKGALTVVLFYSIAALILFAYLIAVCGKSKDGSCKLIWVDSIWTEVHLGFIAVMAVFAVGFSISALEAAVEGQFAMYMARAITVILTALGTSVILASTLSIVRKIKCKAFVDTSVTFKLIKWAWKVFIRVVSAVREYFHMIFRASPKKTSAILISSLFIYTAVIGLCGIFTPESFFAFLFAIIVFGIASFVISYRAKDIEEIKRGANEIKNGNLMYKIPEVKSDDLKDLANNINEIASGLEKSVSEKLKAERLKTELITNVSHDLKTPLTSIISYTELLLKTDGLPEEAMDYIKIIAKKGDKLKNLTQDLFDISKVQSGNENIVSEKLDVALLINQSLGEHDNEIKESGLPFCVEVEKDLYISADGRKMSRVMSNLISNILKYTLQNTRVFITAEEKDGEIVIEFKNISSYPMEFDAEEIVGRFVRGDESRTTDGSGLGLAIAKSYTEACGGTFAVVTDGDLFKAVIKFKKL